MKDIYTKENIDKVVSLYSQGFSITKIKKEVSLGDKAIRKILKENNIAIRNTKDVVSTAIPRCEFEKIIELYESGMFQKEIAELYNVHYQVIARILKANNIDTSTHVRRSQFSREDLDNMCNLYDSGKTLRDIGAIYNVDYTEIAFLFKKIGKQCRDSSHSKINKYKINENFFDIIDTEEKAYIIGLLWADGHNDTDSWRISIQLQECDLNILEKIKDVLESETPIRFYKKVTETRQNSYKFAFANKHMSDRLCELGMVPRKSLILQFPEWLDQNLYPHFLRGYMDGDGHISNRRNIYWCSIVSTDDFCMKVQNIMKLIGVESKIYNTYNKETSTRELRITNKNNTSKFLDYIYKDATIYLQRKYDVYMNKYYNINNAFVA